MMITLRMMGLMALVIFSFTHQANAEVYSFSCITANDAGDCAIGESQLSVELTDAGSGLVDFTFTNNGSNDSTISEIYFDDGTLLGIASIASPSGVAFSQGATPPDLPGGNAVGFDVTAGFLADADNPAPKKGVNAGGGDWVTITIALINGKTFSDTVDAMGTDLRIGVHVINFDSGGSESFIAPSAVPVPAAAWLFGSALITLVGLKRKQ
jgi:hypothetical protein